MRPVTDAGLQMHHPSPLAAQATPGRASASAREGFASTRVGGASARKPGLSTAWYIGAVVLALLVPCLVLSGLFTHKLLQAERSRLEADTVRLTTDLAANLDRFVSSRFATLQALATSPALDTGDYARFEEQARAFTEAEGAHLILRDRTNRQRVNTRLPRGALLPTTQIAGDAALVATGLPYVSDLISDPNTGAPLVLLRVPVVRDGETRYFLSLALSPARLAAALELTKLALPYRSAVTDSAGRIITRSLEPARFIGEKLPGFDAIAGDKGSWTGISAEGLDIFGTFQRSALTGWLVTTGLERAALEAPLRRSLWMLGALAAALLALGLSIAIPIARRLVAAQSALAVIARALHDDEIAPAMATGLRETDQVATEMREAALRLRWQANALEEANRELEQRVAERTVALTETGDFLRATLDSMDQGLAVIDADGRLPIISRRAVQLLGLPPEILGTVVTIEEIRAIQETMGEFARLDASTGAIVALDPVREMPPVYERTRSNGTVVEIRTVAMANGGAVRTYTDITERRRVEAAVVASEKRYRTLADSLPQKVWIAKPDGTAIYFNAQMSAYHGQLGLKLADRIALNHPDDAGRMTAARSEAYRTGTTFEVEGRLRRHDGAWRWHRLVMIPIRSDETGDVTEWLGTSLDIDDIYAAKRRLEENAELLRLAQEAAGAGIWEWDARSDTIKLSCESARMWAWPCEDGQSIEMPGSDWGQRCHPDDLDMVWDKTAKALAERGSYAADFRISPAGAPDGSWRWISGCGRVMLDAQGEPCGMIGLNFDITERKEAERRIEHLARHDELTGLPNRTLFRDHMRRSLALMKRNSNRVALLCLDLDRFKIINDTHGHLAGDELLRQVATRLGAVLRAEDMLARLGGDEFAIVLALRAGPDEAVLAAERLIAAIGEPFRIMGQEITIGISIGIALANTGHEDIEAFYHDADAALYAAKAGGRNTVRVYGADDARMVASV